jgi:hypothetical protein
MLAALTFSLFVNSSVLTGGTGSKLSIPELLDLAVTSFRVAEWEPEKRSDAAILYSKYINAVA